MRLLLVLVASAAALRPSNAPQPLVEKSRRAFGAAAVAGAFVALPANAKIDVNNAVAREFSAYSAVRNQPVRQAGLEVLFTILAASTQRESARRPRTGRLRLTHPNV